MTAWYYSKNGQQNGPVSTDEIIRLFGTGSIGPKDLVWREGMVDWKPAGEVPDLSPKPPASSSVAGVAPATVNPYEPPSVSWNELVVSPEAPGDEIVPGSQPLDIGFCISHSWELMKRHLGLLVAVGVIYLALSVGFSVATEVPVWLMQQGASQIEIEHPSAALKAYKILAGFADQVFDAFLGLGLVRIGLNLVSGKPAEIAMLFGEGRKLVNTILASILFDDWTGAADFARHLSGPAFRAVSERNRGQGSRCH
jgi:hypothetical protein